ncbi:MAG: hypothetical protein AB3N28_08625 [Kordiimonas sp.]
MGNRDDDMSTTGDAVATVIKTATATAGAGAAASVAGGPAAIAAAGAGTAYVVSKTFDAIDEGVKATEAHFNANEAEAEARRMEQRVKEHKQARQDWIDMGNIDPLR